MEDGLLLRFVFFAVLIAVAWILKEDRDKEK